MNRGSKSDQDRIVETEIALTHLQQDYESLNEVVLQQQKTIEGLLAKVQKLEGKIDANSEPEVRDAASEKPPHY